MKRYLLNHWQHSLLSLLLVFVVVNNMIWFSMGGSPLHWDDSIHLSESLEANRILVASSIPLKYMIHFTLDYPPFVSWSAIPFYILLGEGLLASSITMSTFLVVLLLSTYGLGRRLFDESVGLLSALFVSAFPIVIDFSRQFMLDMPLAAMTALSLYLLVRTREFNILGWSLLLGIALGCGLLTKWTFSFFLIYPTLFSGGMIFLKGTDKARRIRNFSLCILAACALSLPWYSAHFVSFLISRSHSLVQGNRSIGGTILYYVQVLPEQTSWLMIPPLAVGIGLYVRKYNLQHLIPILSLVGGYILLTMVILKVPRFAIPLLPPFTVLACAGIVGWSMEYEHLKAVRIKSILVFCAVIVLQYLAITYVTRDSHIGSIVSRQAFSSPIIPVQGGKERNWQQAGILRAIACDSTRPGSGRRSLQVVPEHIFFNWATFEYIVMLNRLPVTILPIFRSSQKSDFTVVKTGDLGEDAANRQQITNAILSDTLNYEFLQSFVLPDSSKAILMRQRVRIAKGDAGIQSKSHDHS